MAENYIVQGSNSARILQEQVIPSRSSVWSTKRLADLAADTVILSTEVLKLKAALDYRKATT